MSTPGRISPRRHPILALRDGGRLRSASCVTPTSWRALSSARSSIRAKVPRARRGGCCPRLVRQASWIAIASSTYPWSTFRRSRKRHGHPCRASDSSRASARWARRARPSRLARWDRTPPRPSLALRFRSGLTVPCGGPRSSTALCPQDHTRTWPLPVTSCGVRWLAIPSAPGAAPSTSRLR